MQNPSIEVPLNITIDKSISKFDELGNILPLESVISGYNEKHLVPNILLKLLIEKIDTDSKNIPIIPIPRGTYPDF